MFWLTHKQKRGVLYEYIYIKNVSILVFLISILDFFKNYFLNNPNI